MTKIVVFDLDDTLYLEQDYVKSGFEAVDRHLSKQNINGFYKLAWQYFLDGGRGNTFNIVLDQLKTSYDKDFILSLIKVYREHFPAISLCSDATTIISKFNGIFPMALITDGYSSSQKQKIAALGLNQYFEKIVVTDDLGENHQYWKPHAKPYETVKSHFGVEHHHCIYIGDNETKDFITANKLGWSTIQIIRQGSEYQQKQLSKSHEAKKKIHSLLELEAII